jgi:uncharacterized protein YegL
MFYAPWLWAMTDGGPTDGQNALDAACTRLKKSARNDDGKTKIDVFMVGIGGHANMNVLQNFSIQRPPLRLVNGSQSFKEMFAWISRSLAQVSQSQPGQQVQHSNPGWGNSG